MRSVKGTLRTNAELGNTGFKKKSRFTSQNASATPHLEPARRPGRSIVRFGECRWGFNPFEPSRLREERRIAARDG
jgi:hypothetical protein